MVRADIRTKTRVGVILFASFILFAGALLFIGGTKGFFVRRTSYFARFPNSQGLLQGNQVRLAGVVVGAVRDIEVPRAPGQDLTVQFDIERKYQHLVKTDSRAEIKTIGLLGDKYLEVPNEPDALVINYYLRADVASDTSLRASIAVKEPGGSSSTETRTSTSSPGLAFAKKYAFLCSVDRQETNSFEIGTSSCRPKNLRSP